MQVQDSRGFSLVELLMVVAIMGTIAVIAVPMSGNSIRYLKISGDARDLANGTAVTKMRAASKFTQARLYVDLSGKTYYVQTFDKTSATCCWVTEGGSTTLSSTVSFSFGSVATPPSNTQTTIGQAPLCKANTTGADVANTACIVFNSRGIPIDSTGSPTGDDALYVTDNTSVYGITVAATGFIRTWQTRYQTTPSWTLQ